MMNTKIYVKNWEKTTELIEKNALNQNSSGYKKKISHPYSESNTLGCKIFCRLLCEPLSANLLRLTTLIN